MTQRRASSRLDFPHPFGPTTPVSPRSMTSSVGSTKDLNPDSLSRVNFMVAGIPLERMVAKRPCLCRVRFVNHLPELLDRLSSLQHLAIYEKCRCCLDAKLFLPAIFDLDDAFCDFFII